MSKPDNDPTGELYALLDQAGLDAGRLLDSKKSMSKIVNEIRTKFVVKAKAYIVRRDHDMFNAGFQSKEPRKIEVKDAK